MLHLRLLNASLVISLFFDLLPVPNVERIAVGEFLRMLMLSNEFQIRASDEDLEKERGAVLEEWRKGKNSGGRSLKAHMKVLFEGSKVTYAHLFFGIYE